MLSEMVMILRWGMLLRWENSAFSGLYHLKGRGHFFALFMQTSNRERSASLSAVHMVLSAFFVNCSS